MKGYGITKIQHFFTEYSSAIRCYRCTVLPNRDPKEKNHFCTKFEETDEYIVDCPYSTMCMKKIFRMRLIDNVTETLIRDCAIQKYTEQVWHKTEVQRKGIEIMF